MNTDKLQYYPTPRSLARRMWEKFEIHPTYNSAILEPSAGKGDLMSVHCDQSRYGRSHGNIDVIEIDFDNQAVLREKGYSVVGHDFLQFDSTKHYTHIVMNPPFKDGAKHVLHAWDILKSGELVALVNAQTIKYTCDKYRKRLAQIIEDNQGTIEYINGAFETPETKNKTSVPCAIIYLKKSESFDDLSFLDTLKPQLGNTPLDDLVSESSKQELTIKEDTIKHVVTVFNAAVIAMTNEIRITHKLSDESAYYAGLLSDSILKRNMTETPKAAEPPTEQYNARYKELKEKAWSHILEATDIGKSLSSSVRGSIERRFKDVIQLEFTAVNIYGFLCGLIEQRTDMNVSMLCDFFDSITEYHIGNRAWYRGWKSNDKHKACAYRIKMTRFILPCRTCISSPSYEQMQFFRDVDLVCSLLGETPLDAFVGLETLFSENFQRLQQGERLQGTYFDVRYYGGAGTIHYYPRDKAFIDRLNRMVGKHRQWLPPQDDDVSNAFWTQYRHAEEITRHMDKNTQKHLAWHGDIESGRYANEIEQAIVEGGKACGLKMDNLLEEDPVPQPVKHQTIRTPKIPAKSVISDSDDIELLADRLKQQYELC